jgi:hypothetical protein
VLTTDEKGSIAELAIASAAARLQIGVFKPLTDGERYDLILDLRPQLLRVQCKWATRYDDVVIVRCYSARRTATGLVRRPYSVEEIDAIGAYCLELETCYLVPIELMIGQETLQLRLRPTRNNQRLRIRWAREFELATTLGRLGAVAQLGERLAGSQ